MHFGLITKESPVFRHGECQFSIILLIEVCIGAFLKTGIIRSHGGDVLIMPAMYFFVRMLYPRKIKLLPYMLFIFAAIVELLQYLNLLELLSIRRTSLLGIILGSTGDIKDIFCYFLGTLLIIAYEVLETKKR